MLNRFVIFVLTISVFVASASIAAESANQIVNPQITDSVTTTDDNQNANVGEENKHSGSDEHQGETTSTGDDGHNHQ